MAESQSNTRYVTLVALGAALGGFLFGYDTSTMNSAINGIRPTLQLSAGEVGFVTAIMLIGAAVGAWFAGGVAERHGRNRVMQVAGALILVGSLVSALSGAVIPLAIFRFVSGVGIGSASAVVPSYISEISPTAIRGRLGTLWQLAIVVGQLLGLLAGSGLTQLAGSESADMPWGGEAWRWMFIVTAVLAVVYLLIVRVLPRSPQDLIRFGHPDQAAEVLQRFNRGHITETIAEIAAAQGENKERATLRDLWGGRFGLRTIVWIGILLAMFQQLVGINVVKTYSNTLWQSVGLSTNASFAVSTITVGVSLVATIIAISIMDKVGRRTLLGWGAAFMVLSLATLAISFSTATVSGDEVTLDRPAGIAALIGMNVFALAFGVSWGPVMWLMLSELFDSHLRAIAVALCTAINWITNWGVTQSFPVMSDTIGLDVTYGIYTFFAIVAFLFTWKVLPETGKRNLR